MLQLEDAVTNMSSPRRPARLARQLALAVALASGTAVLAVPGFTDAAYAQKKKKKGEDAAPKGEFTKPFVDAYNPVNTALASPGADIAALKPQMIALVPLATTGDEKMSLGVMMYNAGITGKDSPLQVQGLDLMLASGKATPEETAKYNFVGYQITNSIKQYDRARAYFETAVSLGYPAPKDELEINNAQLYFDEGKPVDGLKALANAISIRKAAGGAVPESWYRQGVSTAYNNKVLPQVYEFVQGWVGDYPKPENWRDAVNLTRNLTEFDPPVMLDLLRLGRKVGTLRDLNDFIVYVETADPRRLPLEVREVIELAYSSGEVSPGEDSYLDDQLRLAKGLIADDRTGLPSLERDAKAPTAQLRTVMAAGDAFLSYGEHAKAAGFYEKALSMAGVDRNLALTRLGIAQIGAGNIGAARETLAKVEGVRAPIAMLWSAYAAQQGASAATRPAAAE
jgi:tetratricopeptide (TPR) repeat protein